MSAPNRTPDVDSPAETRTSRALVVAHGDFAAGLVSAVQQISGRGDQFVALSNTSFGLDGLSETIVHALDATGARVIFTDLPAGSCTMAVRRLLRDHPQVLLVVGVNVMMLLDFAMHDDRDPADAARLAAERARASIAVHGATLDA